MDLRERNQHDVRHPWEVVRSKFLRRVATEAAPDARRVIDVGSGDSWLATQLLDDLSPDAELICWDAFYTDDDLTEPLPPRMRRTATPPNDGPGDLVLALDVLEHIEDDRAFVHDQLRPLVGSDGVLVVSVPAHQSLFTSHDVALAHYRRHNARTLRNLLAPDFAIVQEGSLFSSLVLPRAVSVLVERVRKPAPPERVESDWRHGPAVTGAVTAALSADAALGRLTANRRLRPPGLSVWAVCTAKTSS